MPLGESRRLGVLGVAQGKHAIGRAFLHEASAKPGVLSEDFRDTLLEDRDRSVVLHPVCSVEKMNLAGLLTEVAEAAAREVEVPVAAGCCGFAGDRGFLLPRLTEAATNRDGRCDRPLLEGPGFRIGEYELLFHAGAYFQSAGMTLPEPKFLDIVPIRFGIAEADGNYHVPLLITPFSYATYRGS